MDIDPSQWFQDKINDNFLQLYRLDEVLYTGKTKYQAVQVARSKMLGICLILDNKIQSTEKDEFIYHETLVHPAMLAHPKPERVFIAGGGEGATLREVLRHNTVTAVEMADIDEEVTALSKKYLPGHSAGAFEDKRAAVFHVDARAYLKKSKEKFDVIIIDLPDPIEEGPAAMLFTNEFYWIARDKLTEEGLIAVQAGSANLTELLNFTAVNKTLRTAFRTVTQYTAYVPCFGGPWGFCIGTRKYNPALLTSYEVDERLKARGIGNTKFYDGETHRAMFSLPPYLREALAAQTRVITDKHPLYMGKS